MVCTPHPSGNSSLGSYFPLKILTFKTTPPPRNVQGPSVVGEWIFSGTTHFATLLYIKLDAKNPYPIPDSPSVNPKFPDKCDPILD